MSSGISVSSVLGLLFGGSSGLLGMPGGMYAGVMLGPACPMGTIGGRAGGLGAIGGIGVNTGITGLTATMTGGCGTIDGGGGAGFGGIIGGICGGICGGSCGGGLGGSLSGVFSGMKPFCLWICSIWSLTEMFARAARAAASAVPL